MPVVEVHDLVKQYRKSKVNAVDGVSFAVRRGEVFGLLGPNGAGKTTTVGILTTRVRRTGGTARVSGVDVGVDPVRARHRELEVVVTPPNSQGVTALMMLNALADTPPTRTALTLANGVLRQVLAR